MTSDQKTKNEKWNELDIYAAERLMASHVIGATCPFLREIVVATPW